MCPPSQSRLPSVLHSHSSHCPCCQDRARCVRSACAALASARRHTTGLHARPKAAYAAALITAPARPASASARAATRARIAASPSARARRFATVCLTGARPPPTDAAGYLAEVGASARFPRRPHRLGGPPYPSHPRPPLRRPPRASRSVCPPPVRSPTRLPVRTMWRMAATTRTAVCPSASATRAGQALTAASPSAPVGVVRTACVGAANASAPVGGQAPHAICALAPPTARLMASATASVAAATQGGRARRAIRSCVSRAVVRTASATTALAAVRQAGRVRSAGRPTARMSATSAACASLIGPAPAAQATAGPSVPHVAAPAAARVAVSASPT